MVATGTSRWEQIRERKLADPAMKDRYLHTRRSVTRVRQVLRCIDDERRKAGLSKAELAEQLGTNPASIRRLLSAESANPTLKTVVEIFDVLGLELSLQPRRSTSENPEHEGQTDATALTSR